jgi:SAM-dependent methyltransferase
MELARLVGPSGRVVGVDMDDVKLALAREAAAERGIQGVEFRAMNVYDWAEPRAYDMVYCRFLLQHLSRPVDVLRTMWDGVRAGGVIVVEDADFEGSFCDPPNAGFAFWVDAYQQVLRRHGGDPLSGRKLHRRFLAAGIPRPDLSVSQLTSVDGESKLLPHSTIAATADAIVDEGIATRAEVDSALADLLDFAADPGSVCGSPRTVQAWSRRASQAPGHDDPESSRP